MEDSELARIRAERMAQLQANSRGDGGNASQEQAEESRERAEQMKNQVLQTVSQELASLARSRNSLLLVFDEERIFSLRVVTSALQILTQEARARLAMIEMTKPELAELAMQNILRMTGGGRTGMKVSDEVSLCTCCRARPVNVELSSVFHACDSYLSSDCRLFI